MNMPYKTFSKVVGGKKMYCAKSVRTGKSFCSDTVAGCEKAMETREKFSHISPQLKRRIAARRLRRKS